MLVNNIVLKRVLNFLCDLRHFLCVNMKILILYLITSYDVSLMYVGGEWG